MSAVSNLCLDDGDLAISFDKGGLDFLRIVNIPIEPCILQEVMFAEIILPQSLLHNYTLFNYLIARVFPP